MGFGKNSRLHTVKVLRLSEARPTLRQGAPCQWAALASSWAFLAASMICCWTLPGTIS